MAGIYKTNIRGIRNTSPVVTVAAAATPENLYIQTTAGAIVRLMCVRKIWAYLGVNCILTIGTGLAPLVAIMPNLDVVGTFLNSWLEDEIPEIWVNATLTIQSTVLGVQVQIEVEEIE